mgnify:CR=1 FL=1
MKKQHVYAVYKGEEIIAIGTARECAEKLGVTPDHIRWMSYPTNNKRNVGGNRMESIIIEEDEQ